MFLTRSKLQEHLDKIFQIPWYSFSFGRTALSRLYKLVHVTGLPPFVPGLSEQICYVRTVGDGAGWRRTRPPTTPVTLGYHQTTVTIDGVMYFLVSRKDKFLCFDLENEEWNREIKCPWTSLDVRLSDINIVELNGALCIAQMKVNTADQALFTDIWLLTDSEKGVWCKAYNPKGAICPCYDAFEDFA
jgi:F-box interacting protein